jgi:glycosyltransferase involved in cell wall biosynthesis
VNHVPALSVVVPTIDETESLHETVQFLLSCGELNLLEVLLIVAARTTAPTIALCQSFCDQHPTQVRIIRQELPLLGGAFRTGIAAARGSHILLMFADLESDPRLVPAMVSVAHDNADAIISASRWLQKESFSGYGRVKLVLNYCFQKMCAIASSSKLTDFTYGFRLYPATVLKESNWRETGHAFVLETILEPALWNVPIIEVPAKWVARRQGAKHGRFFAYCLYVITLFRVLSRCRPIEHHVVVSISPNLDTYPIPAHVPSK